MTAENHEENRDSICLHDKDAWFLFTRPLYRNYTPPEKTLRRQPVLS